jgi:hypothetical protein
VFRPLFEAGAQVVRTLIDSLIGPLQASSKGRFMLPPFNNPGLGMQLALFLLTSPLMAILTAAFIVILAVEVIAKIFLPYLIAATEMLSEFISDNIWWILGLSAVVVAGGLTMGKPGEDPGGMIGFLGNMAGGDTAGWGWWLAAAMTEFGATLFTTFRFVDALFSPGLEALAGLVLLLVSPMFATGLMKLAIDVIGYLLDLHSAAELGQEKLEGAALVSERALVARAVADAISAFSPLISGFLLFTRNYKTETCCVLPWNPIIA